jgi:hypothetical protein
MAAFCCSEVSVQPKHAFYELISTKEGPECDNMAIAETLCDSSVPASSVWAPFKDVLKGLIYFSIVMPCFQIFVT